MRLAAALLLLLAFSTNTLAARVWTDQQGRSVNATFVRLFGEEVVLRKPNGDVFKVPIRSLSAEDQAYLQSKLEDEGFRQWTSVDGKQTEGQYLRVRDGEVFMKINGAPTSIPFDRFSLADQQYIREQAAAEGSEAEVPAATRELGPPRIWKDEDGNTVSAQFDSILPDGRVLLAVDGDTVIIDVKKLSEEDHELLRTILQPQGLARLVPAKPEPMAEPKPEPNPEPAKNPAPEVVAQPAAPEKPAKPRPTRETKPIPRPDPIEVALAPQSTDVERRPVEKPNKTERKTDDSPRSRGKAGAVIWASIALTGIAIASILVIVSHIWIAVIAFKNGDVVWGIGCLFCGLLNLIYACMHSDEASTPLTMWVFGFALQFILSIVMALTTPAVL